MSRQAPAIRNRIGGRPRYHVAGNDDAASHGFAGRFVLTLLFPEQGCYAGPMAAPTLYDLLKFLHITGVVMLMGNITATAIWKFYADRTGDARIVGFAQKLVTYTDWMLTFWGVVLTIGGGYGAAWAAQYDLGERWLAWSQALFLIAGLIWLGLLVPIQVRQARTARAFADGGTIPASYRRDSHRWIVWGLVATLPLIAATWFMVAKPV